MEFNGFKYNVVDNYKDAIDEELLSSKITDYYNDFDYIVGALSYNKISTLDNYLQTKCAYGCKWFCLKKEIEN